MKPSFTEQVENRAQERSHLSLPAQVGELPYERHVLLGHASLKSTFPGLCELDERSGSKGICTVHHVFSSFWEGSG